MTTDGRNPRSAAEGLGGRHGKHCRLTTCSTSLTATACEVLMSVGPFAREGHVTGPNDRAPTEPMSLTGLNAQPVRSRWRGIRRVSVVCCTTMAGGARPVQSQRTDRDPITETSMMAGRGAGITAAGTRGTGGVTWTTDFGTGEVTAGHSRERRGLVGQGKAMVNTIELGACGGGILLQDPMDGGMGRGRSPNSSVHQKSVVLLSAAVLTAVAVLTRVATLTGMAVLTRVAASTLAVEA